MNDILKIPFVAFNDWDVLQKFLERRGNPPYMITDDLDLCESNIESLGNLTSVGGRLDLSYSKIKSLGNLTSVGGKLSLSRSEIEDLGNLTSVGGYLGLRHTNIQSLGSLTSVGGSLYIEKTPLLKKYTTDKIRSMVEVGGEIFS